MAKRRFRDLPEGAAAWVKATILSASLSSTLACGGPTQQDQAPTCGPCCHGGGPECEQLQQTEGNEVETTDDEVVHDVESDDGEDVLPEDEELVDVAPTCGPCCHGTGGPECEPDPSRPGPEIDAP